nr:alpha/beta hydrolases superfamily protein [Tanacetum cinerariifolium]
MNYVRKFLRGLHPKWRTKVTTIKESKDLTSLSLDELIRNLKVHEMIIKIDSEIVKAKREIKSLDLKAKKESSDEECSTSRSKDEEYVMAVRDFNKFLKRIGDRKCFRCGDPNHLIGECPKPLKVKNQRTFVGGSWSNSGEEDDEKAKDEMCLVAQASNEICLGINMETDEWIKDNGCSKHMMGQICDNKCRVTFSEYDCEITAGRHLPHLDHKERFTMMGERMFSKKQTALAISTTKAEYVSAGKACQQALWMKQVIIDYDVRLDDVSIMCDNKGVIDLSKNPVQHSRTKHIEMRHHFLCDNVQKGHISIEKVPFVDNIANILTKPLNVNRLIIFVLV